jgi:hypothetical protein
MLHLPTERLAALSDEPPSSEEAAHLATCEVCARERRAYDALLVMAASERESFGLPLTRWDSIAAAMAAEAPVVVDEDIRPRGKSHRWMLQIAAALLLVAGGSMLGRVSAGEGPLPGMRLSSGTQVAATKPDSLAFVSVEEARAAQQQSEVLYQQATAYLARFDSTASDDGTPVAYRSRLAALDRVLNTTREALRSAPHDPVINGYYLTTLGQREATLRQLNTALPASLRVNSF